MKKLLFVFTAVIFQDVNAQDPQILWQNAIGGGGGDELRSIQQTADGGYILGGNSDSGILGDKTEASQGGYDYWVIKLDAVGNIIWQNTIGGNNGDILHSIQQTADGGYILGGHSASGISGDKTEASQGGSDYWAIKLDALGNIVWQNTIGGSGSDQLRSIQQTTDRGYILGGHSGSGISGDKTEAAQGGNDYWVIKLDSAGNIVWQNTIGGNGTDYLFSIQQTIEGGFVLGGYSLSGISGDKTEAAQGLSDYWVIKLDAFGNIVWQNTIGGGGDDHLFSIQQTSDGGYFLGGDSDSGASGDKTEPGYGSNDLWVVRLDAAGNIAWQNTIGGSSGENLYSIKPTADGGYILGGTSDSGISGDKTEAAHGASDYWVVKLDTVGNIAWQNTIGGNVTDYLFSIQQTLDGGYILGGHTVSGISGDKTEPGQGSFDYWVIKLSQPFWIAQGNVSGDINSNCNVDTSDISFPRMLVKAEGGTHTTYEMTDANGNYAIYLSDSGSYNISVAQLDTLWQPSCATSYYNIQLTGTSDTVSGINFIMQAAFYCPRLTVGLGTPLLRRCINNNFTITYRNTGTLPASNAYIEVDFGDYLQPQSSSVPWTSVSGNVYTFPIENLNTYQQGLFNVTALLDCAADLGSTQCVTAHIYPDSLCLPTPAGWDKSEAVVSGTCVNDSLVCFTIKNRSAAGSGDMGGAAQWRLYVNDTLVTQGTYQLTGGDSIVKCFPANGKTYRLEADQNLPHPRRSKPQAIVEVCGSPTTFGFVNTVPQDDEELAVETFCMEVRGSFDPNDKQVSPIGITSNNYITADDELEYLIRFQNTGTDTAFKVVIRDTIATDVLDIATLVSGASSHDYTFNIYGQGIAEWTFDNILLPDSFVNEPASHGFVQFKIRQLPGNADGTLIENRAAIYFDFNAPVITNTARNEVNEGNMPQAFLSAAINNASDVRCYGDSNGVASVSATGGLPPYQFAWSNGATTASASNLFAGNYSITITDAAENSWTDYVSIAQPTLLEAAITGKTDVLCYGDGTGTATASATGGTTPYTYEWSHQGSAFATATSLNAGVYSVTVWDAHLCTATTSSVTITEPTQLTTLISTQSGVTCFGGNDAAAKANPAGGVAPYSAMWSNGETDFTANDLSAGNYQVTVTDSNGCALVSSITIQDALHVNLGEIQGPDTIYDITQNVTYSVQSDTGYTYNWAFIGGFNIQSISGSTVVLRGYLGGQTLMTCIATGYGCADTVAKGVFVFAVSNVQSSNFSEFELYPNPTNDKITLQAANIQTDALLRLYDSVGKELLQQTATSSALQQGIVFDLNAMNEGVFYLSIKTEAGMRVMKVVRY